MKYLILIALLLLSIPLWLPSNLGGRNSYHYVLTGSMKGTIDPGSFVVVRRMDAYDVGDVVAFKQDPGIGQELTILHRIIGQQADGKFLIKGDAVTSVDEVDKSAVVGRMVAAVPGLGFLPGAFRQAPLPIGGLLLALMAVGGRMNTKKSPAAAGTEKLTLVKKGLFLPALLLVLCTIPFATVGLAVVLGKAQVIMLLFAGLGLTRFVEINGADSRDGPMTGFMVELAYIMVIILSVSTVSLPHVIQSFRTGVGL